MSTMSNANVMKVSEVYSRYFDEALHYFLKYTHDMMKAEDMVQDLFIKLISYDDMIIGETSRSFVFTIARRMVIDDARHQQFVRQAQQGYAELQSRRFWQDSETLECKQIEELERAKLLTMPKRMAEVYSMTRYDEKSAQELADELHISKRTVEYHLLVARKEMRNALRPVIGL